VASFELSSHALTALHSNAYLYTDTCGNAYTNTYTYTYANSASSSVY
jgi:hypothetical protein